MLRSFRIMRAHRASVVDRAAIGFSLCLTAPAATAHDMINVFVAYSLVLAIPIPALLALVGWKLALLWLIPLYALALWLANSGDYKVMYFLLLLPYFVLLARSLFRRIQKGRLDA